MRKIIIILATIVFIMAFNNHKCDHVFVKVEKEVVKIEYTGMTPSAYHELTGMQEGDELVCLKCFHKQKQVLDYGPSRIGTGAF